MNPDSLKAQIARIAEKWIYRTAHNGCDHLCNGIAADILALPDLAALQAENTRLTQALLRVEQMLCVPAAEYVPAIRDVWDVIDKALGRRPHSRSTPSNGRT